MIGWISKNSMSVKWHGERCSSHGLPASVLLSHFEQIMASNELACIRRLADSSLISLIYTSCTLVIILAVPGSLLSIHELPCLVSLSHDIVYWQ
jgi:hypothetical protein